LEKAKFAIMEASGIERCVLGGSVFWGGLSDAGFFIFFVVI